MQRIHLQILCLACAALLRPQVAAAELICGESLEWLVADSERIVRGEISSVRAFQDERQVPWEEATVQVSETIKGAAERTVTFLVRCVGRSEKKPSAWKRAGGELLLFLNPGSRYTPEDPGYETSAFALRHWGSELSFVRFNDQPPTGVFTMDFQVIKNRDEILKAARVAAAMPSRSQPLPHRVEVPWESEVYRTLYSGSSVELVVPADERLERRAWQWSSSEDPDARQQAALALRFFKSPENTRRLRPLLSDPAFLTRTQNQVKSRVYYVREAAFKTLSQWGVEVDKPVIEVPLDELKKSDVPSPDVAAPDVAAPDMPRTDLSGPAEPQPAEPQPAEPQPAEPQPAEPKPAEPGKLLTWRQWYDNLWKPSWTPAPATIGLIWQLLYPIILVTFGFVFVQAFRRQVPWLVALPFAINLGSNLIFTPIQFGMRNLPLATIDILIVWGTIIWMMAVIWDRYKWVAIAQVPYLIWVSTATVLQLSITWGNR